MTDTSQELEVKAKLHETPITDKEIEKVLEPLKSDDGPITHKLEAEEALNERATDAQNEQSIREKYDSDMDRIADALKFYQENLGKLWDAEDYKTYETTSREMRDFHDVVVSMLKSVPESVRNEALEDEIQKQFSELLEKDGERLRGIHGARDAHDLRMRQSASETLAPSREASDDIRSKVEKKVVLDSEFEALKAAFERLASKGTPTNDQIKMLHEGIKDIRDRMGQDAGELKDKLDALENEYPAHVPIDLTAIRSMVHNARLRYADIQHQLAPDQRRAFRGRIAKLSSLVRQVEDNAWHALMSPHVRNTKKEYFRSDKHVNASLVLAITRARRVSQILADLTISKGK